LVNVVDEQILDEVGNRKGEKENAVDLRAVSDAKNSGGYSWKDAQMPSIDNIAKDHINKVGFLDVPEIDNGEC